MRLYLPSPYYGFNHDMVKEKFEGKPEFLTETCIEGAYEPVAVYYVKKPNRKLDHKTYMLLFTRGGQIYVSGRHAKDMKEWRYQTGIYCEKCNTATYSINRHDYHHCACGRAMVDGGRDYLKSNLCGLPVKIDLFEKRIQFFKTFYRQSDRKVPRTVPEKYRARKWYPLEVGDGLERAKQKAVAVGENK